MGVLTALRARLTLSILAVAGAAMFLALSPANARAECVSSALMQSVTTDAADDNLSGAPDIRELRVGLDGECQLTVRPVNYVLPVLEWQFLVVSFDLDGDEVEDRWVYVFGGDPVPVLDDGVDLIPLPFVESAGFRVTLDELGVTTSPTEIGIAVTTWYDDPAVEGDEFPGDYYPELTEPMLRLPISFATPVLPPRRRLLHRPRSRRPPAAWSPS
jgi:hypothetical protein